MGSGPLPAWLFDTFELRYKNDADVGDYQTRFGRLHNKINRLNGATVDQEWMEEGVILHFWPRLTYCWYWIPHRAGERFSSSKTLLAATQVWNFLAANVGQMLAGVYVILCISDQLCIPVESINLKRMEICKYSKRVCQSKLFGEI